ncbi:MAG: DUF1353 domain-containing protein [Candidatus Cloacimonadota bacterium]|nr:DUF1353 domain-containing protein [Candidatus Cloacimonadota bacterium]
MKQVTLTKIGGDKWIVAEKFTFVSNIIQEAITIPRGFQTDLASIPRGFRWLISVNNNSVTPAVIHDYLYATKGIVSRKEADLIFLEMLKRYKVSYWKRKSMYYAVRMFGKKYYKGKE